MISPDDTFTKPLTADPDGPAIVVRYGSSRSWSRYEQELSAIYKAKDDDGRPLSDAETYARVEKLLDTVIAERRGIESLGDLLTDRQLALLAGGLRGDAYLSEADQKNSESPSPSVAAASAGTADPTAASA